MTLWVRTRPLTSELYRPLWGDDDFADMALSSLMDFDRTMEAVDSEMKRLRRDMNRSFQHSQHQLANALSNVATRPGSLLEHRMMQNPIQTDAEGNRQLKCVYDMRSFKPEEINVTLDTKNRCIKIEAEHEVKDDQGRHCVKRHYSRHFYLPEDPSIDYSNVELKSMLTPEGQLCIEAPLPKAPPKAVEQEKNQAVAKSPEPTPIAVKKI